MQGAGKNDQPRGQQHECVNHGHNDSDFRECLPIFKTQDIGTEIDKRKERDEQSHSGPPNGKLSFLHWLRANTEVYEDENTEQSNPFKCIDPQD